MIYDVAVIGAGVVGALTARELTKYNIKVALIEKECDVAMGTSKGNSAIIHAGFDAEPGTLKAEFNVKGCGMVEKLASDLQVPYEKNASLVCAFDEKDTEQLKVLKERGEINGVKQLEIISGDRLFKLEPNLSREVKAALYAPTAGIICPYLLTISAVENAVMNGCDLIVSFKVDNIESHGDYLTVKSEERSINARYIVNSAGLYSDDIAAICGDIDVNSDSALKIIPRRGEYMLMDKKAGTPVKTTLFSVPSEKGKGILVSPTVDGNLILGPNANETEKTNTSTTSEGLLEVETGAKRLVPSLNMRQVITSFAGVRATPSNHDFNIFPSENKDFANVVHLIGIESPGFASSPAIAEHVKQLLENRGLVLSEKPDFNPKTARMKPFRDMTDEERAEAISKNPLYGKIICRCETVTEAEIINFIHSPCPAKNVDSVKRRTRAGMGRCQGGFCSPRVVDILARELNEDMMQITKKGGQSFILLGKTK